MARAYLFPVSLRVAGGTLKNGRKSRLFWLKRVDGEGMDRGDATFKGIIFHRLAEGCNRAKSAGIY